MNLKVSYLILITLLCFFGIAKGQNSFKITGGNLKVTENVAIVLKDCQLQNDGVLLATEGIVEIKGTGTKMQSEIGGTGTTTFHNLKINKSTNDVQLGTSILVNNQLEMTSGRVDLQAYTLTLGTANGTLVGENETTYITSTSTGQIVKTIDLNSPNNQNPGNLGIEITSTANLGLTEIRRGHNHQTVPSGTSIFRHFTITPTNNSGLNASLKFHYLDAELNGIQENALALMENNNGWMIDGFDSRDANINTLSFSGYDDLYQYTLGANIDDGDMDGIVEGMDNCPYDPNADQADADNDMVGDICDECANGDDLLDANMDGVIDDCECKGSMLTPTGIINKDSVYVSSNTILSDEIISPFKKVIYKANTSITLSTGFHAVAGTEFLATISTCQNPLSLTAPANERQTNNETSEPTISTNLSVFPNPISTQAKIKYTLPQTEKISLYIQDLNGKQLALLIDQEIITKGIHQVDWSANHLNAGMYLLQLEGTHQKITKKLVVVN